ncbi:MAG TPA: DALR anticodon-binding domain-containing protein, partial [Cyclobacteriaceae bacterium]|nr:DALR anticodon-binding domain-containing protein [Cyclobacteriaceae bacterium]
ILRKAASMNIVADSHSLQKVTVLEPAERDVIFKINQYTNKLQEAAREYSPSIIANYAYELAKAYNQFYQAIPIFNESDADKLKFRIAFSEVTATTIKKAMALLGIRVPERM